MFTKTLLASLFGALAAAQSSVLSFTRVPNPVTDGEVQVLLYTTNNTITPVSIILRKGASDNLDTIYTVTNAAQNGQYLWTPPTWIASDTDYALEIKQGNQVNYFGPFTIQGSQPAAVASHSSSLAAYSSSMSSANATHTTTAVAAAGTISMGNSTVMHRNTTMVHATLTGAKNATAKTTLATGHATHLGGAGRTTSTNVLGATQTGSSQTSAAASASSSGAASLVEVAGGSTFALLFGGVAALFYL